MMPLPLGVILVIVGVFFLYTHKTQKAKVALSLSILWIFLFSYGPFSNLLLHSIETTYPTLHKAPKDVKYIYVLGNGHTTDESLPITSQVSQTAMVRLNEGIRLYHQLHENAILIVSGYSGPFDPNSHAIMQEKLALALGVKKGHIIVRSEPKDTQEEALAAKEICGNENFILVTSASHMGRSMKYFNHVGLNPFPAPTNHLSSVQHPNYADIFSSDALVLSRIAMHEYLGLL